MSLKVLIADGDWRFAHQASNLLESHAHLVARESTAAATVCHAESWKPDLVILAAELTEETEGLIAQLKQISPKPAVLLTGWLDRYDRIWRAWQTGGDELLIKPVLKSHELMAAVVTAMENSIVGVRGRSAPRSKSA